MDTFRHFPFSFWAAVVAALLLVSTVAMAAGSPSTPDADLKVDRAVISSLRARMPNLIRLTATPDVAIQHWARGTAELAEAARDNRAADAGDDDRLVGGYASLAAAARALAATPLDAPDDVRAAAAAVLTHADLLVVLLHGASGSDAGPYAPFEAGTPHLDGPQGPPLPAAPAPTTPGRDELDVPVGRPGTPHLDDELRWPPRPVVPEPSPPTPAAPEPTWPDTAPSRTS